MTEIRTSPGGSVKITRDGTLNDSDKTLLTVPTGKVAKLIWISAEITCTATVGNRNLECLITDGTNIVWTSAFSGAITASQIGGIFLSTGGAGHATGTARGKLGTAGSAQNVTLQGGLPEMYLPAGYTVRIYDIAAVDAAADDLVTVISYVEYDA